MIWALTNVIFWYPLRKYINTDEILVFSLIKYFEKLNTVLNA